MKSGVMPVFFMVKVYVASSPTLPFSGPSFSTSILHKSKSAKAKSLSSAVKDCEDRVFACIVPKQGVSPSISVTSTPSSVNAFGSSCSSSTNRPLLASKVSHEPGTIESALLKPHIESARIPLI